MKTDSTIMEADSTTIENDSMEFQNSVEVDSESNLINDISKNYGFFHQVMRPMLKLGHEGELLEWMKEFNLIPSSTKCAKEMAGCSMVWTSTRVVDKWQWQCNSCNQKIHIRENSFFKNLYCNLSNIFKIILAWCEDTEIGNIAAALGIKIQIINSIYDKLERVVSQRPTLQLGGPGRVLMIELYPDIVGELYPDSSKNDNSPKTHTKILCLVDTKVTLCEEILNVLEKTVSPGGYCVVGSGAQLVPVLDATENHKLFSGVSSVSQLTPHTSKDMHVFMTNSVWKPAIKLCEAAQDLPKNKMQTYLSCSLWRRRVENSDPFQSVIHLIAEQNHDTTPSPKSGSRNKSHSS